MREMSNRIRCVTLFTVTAILSVFTALAVNVSDLSAAPARQAQKVSSIKINGQGNSLLINKREKKRLKVKVKPKSAANKTVVWKSSKKRVVTVNQKGWIRGRSYGKAYITARAKDGSGKKAKLRVQVGRKVAKVQLSSSNMSLDVRTQARLSSVVSPANATKRKLDYQSSNTGVATITSTGVVKGKSKGTCTITAKARDGSGKKAVCRVQVVVPSKSILIDSDTKGTKLEVGQRLTIGAVVQPVDASNQKVLYSSTNPQVASVSKSGTVTGVSAGTATIRVNAADGRSSATVEVEVYKVELKDQKLIAHRGLSSEAPENTTPAFELAVQRGFYGVECDIRKTIDDHFVIMHDADLSRMCGYNLAIENMDLQQVKRFFITSGSNIDRYQGLTIPTLEEYLEIMAKSSRVHPFIELKQEFSDQDLKRIVKKVQDYGLLDRTYFISYYKSNLLSLKEITGVNPEGLQYVYGAEESNRLAPVDDSVINWCIQNSIDLDARHTLISASQVFRLHEAGRKVNVWTVNVLAVAYDLITDTRVDMVTTEYYLNS